MKLLVMLLLFMSISLSATARTHHAKKKAPRAARTEAVLAQVPAGVYVHDDTNPQCGLATTLASIGSDPKVVAAVAKTMGPKAAAVVILVNKADEVASKSGGDLAGLWNRAWHKKEGASCAAMCIRLPRGARPTMVQLSDRHGAGGHSKPFVDGSIAVNDATDDYSAWRDVVSAKSNGRWLVCGTAANWSHDQTATKRMAVNY